MDEAHFPIHFLSLTFKHKSMKYLSFLLFLGLLSCSQSKNDTALLQKQIDSLQHKLDNVYKPGLGEFMLGIQTHHDKLWFAGQYKNWELATFELDEINETLQNIHKYCGDRKELEQIGMLPPALEAVRQAVLKRGGCI